MLAIAQVNVEKRSVNEGSTPLLGLEQARDITSRFEQDARWKHVHMHEPWMMLLFASSTDIRTGRIFPLQRKAQAWVQRLFLCYWCRCMCIIDRARGCTKVWILVLRKGYIARTCR